MLLDPVLEAHDQSSGPVLSALWLTVVLVSGETVSTKAFFVAVVPFVVQALVCDWRLSEKQQQTGLSV